MPQCNGLEAARTLRSEPRTSGIAIVAHTALDELDVRQQLMDDEFDGYLQKGRPLNETVALINTLAQ